MNMPEREYDYIVVGGGSSGCVVAARLAAETDASVALIERGRIDSNRWIHLPATFFKVLQSQDAETIASEPDASLDGASYRVPQARVLGGGSSVNGMIYMRGQAQDYDDWVNEHGCDGWSYQEVLPVFRRQENNLRLHNDYHGNAGKLRVADPKPAHPVSRAIIEAAVAAGIPYTDDFNGRDQRGAGWYQITAANGQRQSAAHCFLKPELSRDNLHLLTEVSSRRILFKHRSAYSVEVSDREGKVSSLAARREIILCAGSFQTPKLLMLSGIGPAESLNSVGVSVIHNSWNTGQNYQDHVGTPVTFELSGVAGLHRADHGLNALKHGINHYVLRRGLLHSNLLDAGACVDTAGSGRADVQYNFAPFAPGAPGHPPMACHAVQIHPMTMRPRSRGSLTLRSANPDDALLFNSNALDHPDDFDTLRRGVRLAQKIARQSPLRDMLGEAIWPPKGTTTAAGSNSLDAAIRSHARTIFHPAGTCKMGPRADAVVDTRLRVNGVENLRIADCSVMPALVSGNTNAPTMMIADRCVDFLLEDA